MIDSYFDDEPLEHELTDFEQEGGGKKIINVYLNLIDENSIMINKDNDKVKGIEI